MKPILIRRSADPSEARPWVAWCQLCAGPVADFGHHTHADALTGALTHLFTSHARGGAR